MSALVKIDPHSLSVRDAKLPVVYESAKLALAECYRIDECAEWANKAEALASYARQADDDELLKTATRVKARAIRRCGELLQQIEKAHGANQNISAVSDTKVTRTAIAQDAGLSRRQQITAVRVANVPEPQFENLVESPKPPTLTKLASIGTKPQPKPLVDLNGREASDFRESTKGQGAIGRMVAAAQEIDAGAIVRGASQKERLILRNQISTISGWLKQLQEALNNYDQQ